MFRLLVVPSGYLHSGKKKVWKKIWAEKKNVIQINFRNRVPQQSKIGESAEGASEQLLKWYCEWLALISKSLLGFRCVSKIHIRITSLSQCKSWNDSNSTTRKKSQKDLLIIKKYFKKKNFIYNIRKCVWW